MLEDLTIDVCHIARRSQMIGVVEILVALKDLGARAATVAIPLPRTVARIPVAITTDPAPGLAVAVRTKQLY